MAPTSPLPISFLMLLLCAAASPLRASFPSDDLSAYEVLESYDFPVGLLPKGVLGYDLDRSNGRFAARLNGSCSFSLKGSYQLRYQPTITGIISRERLDNLQGVSVKVLFFWVNIVEVTRRGDELRFSVGIASADFGIDSFLQCPRCGCGLDCVNGEPASTAVDRLLLPTMAVADLTLAYQIGGASFYVDY